MSCMVVTGSPAKRGAFFGLTSSLCLADRSRVKQRLTLGVIIAMVGSELSPCILAIGLLPLAVLGIEMPTAVRATPGGKVFRPRVSHYSFFAHGRMLRPLLFLDGFAFGLASGGQAMGA